MKRFNVVLVLVAFMCSFGFADEIESAEKQFSENSFGYRFVSGGFWNCGGERSGGFGEFGISLADEKSKHLVLRDCITVGGYGCNVSEKDGIKYSELQICDKFIIGGVYNTGISKIRSYAFVNCGIGFWGDVTNKFASGSPLLEIGGGGGFEYQFAPKSAFVIEYGGRCEGPVGKRKADFEVYTNSSPVLTIGYRSLY